MPVPYEQRDLNYRRARSGRPIMRLKAKLKAEGSHVCWLCSAPINMALHWRDPMSWSLDHAQPVSLGGDALDPANAREAHRICNLTRQNRNPDVIRKVKRSRNW